MEHTKFYKPAGRLKRIISYLIDIMPVVLLVYAVTYYFVPSYRQAFDAYFANPREDLNEYSEFLKYRNYVRDFSLVVWSIYSLIMDALPMQGTLGKKLFGLQVVDSYGNKLSFRKSVVRNFAKVVGTLPLCLGMFWIFFDKYKRPLHDKLSGTFVVEIEDNVRHDSNLLNDYILQKRSALKRK